MQYLFQADQIPALISSLQALNYQIIGPTVENKTIAYNYIKSPEDLPQGWTEEQEKGYYRIRRRDDQAYFGYTVGPHSWKNFLFPPKEKLWTAKKNENGFSITEEKPPEQKTAFLGVRSCDLHAITIQDKIFLKSQHTNSFYKVRREAALIIAVNCTTSSKTCFCTSMNTGPSCSTGYDLALTEVIEQSKHFFLCTSGSERGEELLDQLRLQLERPTQPQTKLHPELQSEFRSGATLKPASPEEINQAQQLIEENARTMYRKLDTKNIKEDLYKNFSHPQWDDIAKRCLNCANCTLVCPTCFCSTVEDVSDLNGSHSERWRLWDSCFSLDHSHVHGGNIRASVESRYRQWMTHKLASWIDQFGTSGCVGCGRCIAWCPVGIDLTEEVKALRMEKKT